MIERHIPFTVLVEHRPDFEQFFATQYRPAAEQMPGLLSIGLLRAEDDPSHYSLTFRWTDADSAAGWRTSLAHENLQPTLHALSSMGELRVFDVVG